MVSVPPRVERAIRVAQLIPETEAEGPSRRFALWVQGCPLRCPSCCNPEMLPFSGGTEMTVSELVAEVKRARDERSIVGVSLLGGEPFAHAESLAVFAEAVRELGLDVMVYSGFTLDELREKRDPGVAELLSACDLLVDGPYDRTRPEGSRSDGQPPRRWIGSTNQVMHFLSDRYRADDPRMVTSNTVELRLSKDGELVVNGWPEGARAMGVAPFKRRRS